MMQNIRKQAKEIQDALATGAYELKMELKDEGPRRTIRRTGSTFWLLNAAMDNPYCYLVFENDDLAAFYEKAFQQEMRRGEKHSSAPVFLSYDRFMELAKSKEGLLSMPVIFDLTVVRKMEIALLEHQKK